MRPFLVETMAMQIQSTLHSKNLAPTRLLAVDDVAMNLTLLSDVLTAAGFTLDTAASATEGLRLARLKSYALLLFDIQLPDFNGDVLLQKLRSDSAAASCKSPAFALTGELNPALRDQLIRVGFVQVFAKPWSHDAIVAAIRSVLGLQPASAQAAALGQAQNSDECVMFDQVQALKTTGGDEKLMLKLRAMLIADLKSRIAPLRAAFAQQDWVSLSEHRHKLAGAAGFTGAVRLAAALEELKASPDETTFAGMEASILAITGDC